MTLRRRITEPAWQRQGNWCRRVLRGLRPDRNPLRRTTDRLETYLLAALFVTAAAGAPFAAQVASHAAYASALRVQQAQTAARHQVPAVLTQRADSVVSGYTLTAQVPVQAAWTSVTGVRHTGQVLAPADSPKGTTVTVWTDTAGDLTSPPLQPAQVSGQGELAAMGAVTGVAMLWLWLTALTRFTLNRRRMAAWDADWAVTARAWNRQRW